MMLGKDDIALCELPFTKAALLDWLSEAAFFWIALQAQELLGL